jgi:integrase
MARKPTVRYWKSRSSYCCEIDGTQHILAKGPDDAPKGPTYLEALARFRKLLALDADKGTDDYLVSSLFNQYRIHLHATRKSSVPGIFDVMAKGFVAEFGHRRVRELKPYDFDDWLRRQTNWNSTSKAHAVSLLLGAISWAKRKDFIKTDPLTGRIERPVPVLRGREARMSEELMDVLLAACFEKAEYHRKEKTDAPAVHHRKKGHCEPFGRFLWLLRLTGCRPIELRSAEAHNYEGGRLLFRWNATQGYVHKTAKKTQRDRIIFLTPEARVYVEECIGTYPEGPIFRTHRGLPWIQPNCTESWKRLMRRPKVAAYLAEHGIDGNSLKMYNFRHTAISSFLDNGGDIYVASQLFGTSVKMIEKRYGHPNLARLEEQFLAFMPKVTVG